VLGGVASLEIGFKENSKKCGKNNIKICEKIYEKNLFLKCGKIYGNNF